jgi:diguanylate cyclase (GGDEF)-like protein
MTLVNLGRRLWRGLWAVLIVALSAVAVDLLIPTGVDLGPLHWLPALFWPAVLVLCAVFVRSRLFFGAALAALVWLPNHPAFADSIPLITPTLLHAALPLGLMVLAVVAGRGLFTGPAIFSWAVLVVLAAPVVLTWLEPTPKPLEALSVTLSEPHSIVPGLKLSATQGLYLIGGASLVPLGVVRNRLTEGLPAALLVCGLASFEVSLALNAVTSWTVTPLLALVAVLIEAYALAYIDTLTGVPGRRALEESGQQLGRKYTVAMIDIDHFKSFNDKHGHEAGDQVLRLTASMLSDVRQGGKTFRYGGEEFTILFRHERETEIRNELERLRAEIENYPFVLRSRRRTPTKQGGKALRGSSRRGPTVKVTISLGYAVRRRNDGSLEDVMERADQALYKAKKRGRNRVEAAG